MAGRFTEVYGPRWCTLLGATMSAVGLIAAGSCRNVPTLILTQGEGTAKTNGGIKLRWLAQGSSLDSVLASSSQPRSLSLSSGSTSAARWPPVSSTAAPEPGEQGRPLKPNRAASLGTYDLQEPHMVVPERGHGSQIRLAMVFANLRFHRPWRLDPWATINAGPSIFEES